MTLNLKSIFGTHAALFYYDFLHLLTNMLPYIKEGLQNGELILISMEPQMYEKLIITLKENKIDVSHIQFKPVKPLIEAHKSGGVAELSRGLQTIISAATEQGFTGIRYIGQPSFAMHETSKQDFLAIEQDFTQAFANQQASLLCIYDFEDYLDGQQWIDQTIVEDSLLTHTHLLHSCELYKPEQIIITSYNLID